MNQPMRPRQIMKPVTPVNLQNQIPPEALPGEGRPPLIAGAIGMTPSTRKSLEAVGWRDGDPIPSDLGARLQEIQAEVLRERETVEIKDTPLAAGWRKPVAKFVDITELPKDKQDEIRDYLAQHKADIAELTNRNLQDAVLEAKIPAGVQGEQRALLKQQMAASMAAAEARETPSAMSDAEVYDDRGTTPKPAPAATPQPSPQPVQVPDSDNELPATGVETHPINCQRCQWPLEQPFDVVATNDDKKGFMAAILGLGRFEKQYGLLGGNLRVTYRSLSSAESAMIQQQLAALNRTGVVVGDAEYWSRLMEYRLVLSVAVVSVAGNVVYNATPITEWEKANPPVATEPIHATPIPRLCEFFYANVAVAEPMRRILGMQHQEFQRLVELLEVMTNVADFWKGIELRA